MTEAVTDTPQVIAGDDSSGQRVQTSSPSAAATVSVPEGRVPGTEGPSDCVSLAVGIAWPLTVVFLAVFFSKNIRRLLDGIREGGIGAWWFKRDLSGSSPPPPATGPAALSPTKLSSEATELLATLWKHHVKHFGRDFTTKRWTFMVSPVSPRYPAYLKGLAETVEAGLVAVSPQTLQCLLTNSGVDYCSAHEADLKGDFWP